MTATIQEVAGKAFDYVIIGGGTSGLTLAARLSENSNASVLVLEAGKANLNDSSLLRPGSYGSHFSNADQSWHYQTAEQEHAGGTKSHWFRGKGLGGSSAINFMCYMRPPAEDINDVERLGNPGWNWTHYNRLLQKVEGFVPPEDGVLEKLQLTAGKWNLGTDGPLKLSLPKTVDAVEAKVHEAMLNAGVPPAPDPFGGDSRGFYLTPSTWDPMDNTRSYSTTAFYTPNKHRTNLTVLVEAPVTRIVTETSGTNQVVAKSVVFTHGGQVYTTTVKKEVILCAGTPKSPHILELSGIGNRDILDKIAVPVKLDLPAVGENVQEHLHVDVSYEIKDEVPWDTMDILRDPEVFAKHLALYESGSGIFTQGIVTFAFVPLNTVSPRAFEIINAAKETYPKKMEACPGWMKDQYAIQLQRLERGGPGCEFIIFPGLLSASKVRVPGKRYITIVGGMNHVWSRGTVHSTSNDPTQEPELNPHDFEEAVDMQIAIEMLHFMRKLASTNPLKDLLSHEVSPGPGVASDEDFCEHVKQSYSSTFHTVGSCSMLPRERGGVVDTNLKVYGTDNIRVADLSVLPINVAAHTLSTAYAIAEHAAEVISGPQV